MTMFREGGVQGSSLMENNHGKAWENK